MDNGDPCVNVEDQIANDQTSLLVASPVATVGAQPASRFALWWRRWSPCLAVMLASLVAGAGGSILQPITPGLKKEYFGSDAKAAMVQSIVDCIAAVVMLFVTGVYGRLLDSVGRRPFFLVGSVVGVLPSVALFVFPHCILIYIIAKAVVQIVQASYYTTYLTDKYEGWARAMSFSCYLAAGQLSAVFGLFVSSWSDRTCNIFAMVCAALVVPLTVVVFDESLDRSRIVKFSWNVLGNPLAPLKMLAHSKPVLAGSVILFCFLAASVGAMEVYIYYLNDRVNFTKDDLAWLYMESGIMQPIVLLLLFPLLMRILTPILVLFVALVALIAQLILLASVWAVWPIYALGVPAVSLSHMGAPTIISIISNAGDQATQGQRMTGVAASMQLAIAIGDLSFGLLYGNLPHPLSFLPFVVAALVVVPAGFLTFKLPHYILDEQAARVATLSNAQSSSNGLKDICD